MSDTAISSPLLLEGSEHPLSTSISPCDEDDITWCGSGADWEVGMSLVEGSGISLVDTNPDKIDANCLQASMDDPP